MRPRISRALYSPPPEATSAGRCGRPWGPACCCPAPPLGIPGRNRRGPAPSSGHCRFPWPRRRGRSRFRLGFLSSPASVAKNVTSRGSVPRLVMSKTAHASVLSCPVWYEVPRNGTAVARWRIGDVAVAPVGDDDGQIALFQRLPRHAAAHRHRVAVFEEPEGHGVGQVGRAVDRASIDVPLLLAARWSCPSGKTTTSAGSPGGPMGVKMRGSRYWLTYQS